MNRAGAPRPPHSPVSPPLVASLLGGALGACSGQIGGAGESQPSALPGGSGPRAGAASDQRVPGGAAAPTPGPGVTAPPVAPAAPVAMAPGFGVSGLRALS